MKKIFVCVSAKKLYCFEFTKFLISVLQIFCYSERLITIVFIKIYIKFRTNSPNFVISDLVVFVTKTVVLSDLSSSFCRI